MATLTQAQLTAVEKNETYKDRLRIAGLSQAAFQKAAAAAATETWFRNRQTAENILANPQVSIQREYWAAKSIGTLKNLNVTGIDETSTADAIVGAISDAQYDTLGTAVFDEEKKKVLF